MSLPASTTGAHAKKQGEDLSDNDGDEDEGIFHGEQRWCMTSFFSFFFFIHLSFSVFQNQPSSAPLTLDQCVIKSHNERVCV